MFLYGLQNKASAFAISVLASYLYKLQHIDRYKNIRNAGTHTHTMDSGYNIHHIILRHHPWASVGYHHGEPESVENDSLGDRVTTRPGIGLLFYFFFGQDNRKQRIISRRTYKRIMKRPQEGKLPQDACSVPAPYQPLVTLLTNSNQSSLLYGSDITIYTNGTDKFHDLCKRLPKQPIIFTSNITSSATTRSETRSKTADRESQKGVEVRVLYDDVGCWNVKDKFFKEMSDAGIEVHAFLKVAFPVFTSKVNYRNHRKIVVIDGKVGFMGGMNIADRYTKGTSWGHGETRTSRSSEREYTAYRPHSLSIGMWSARNS